IEWPGVVEPRVTNYPACVMDLFPTVADVLSLPDDALLQPCDGISLRPLFTQDLAERGRPIGFRYQQKRALIVDRYKLLTQNIDGDSFELYDLVDDPRESHDLTADLPEVAARMRAQLLEWNASVNDSFAGSDYPEGRVVPPDPAPVNWYDLPQYHPYLTEWRERW